MTFIYRSEVSDEIQRLAWRLKALEDELRTIMRALDIGLGKIAADIDDGLVNLAAALSRISRDAPK